MDLISDTCDMGFHFVTVGQSFISISYLCNVSSRRIWC